MPVAPTGMMNSGFGGFGGDGAVVDHYSFPVCFLRQGKQRLGKQRQPAVLLDNYVLTASDFATLQRHRSTAQHRRSNVKATLRGGHLRWLLIHEHYAAERLCGRQSQNMNAAVSECRAFPKRKQRRQLSAAAQRQQMQAADFCCEQTVQLSQPRCATDRRRRRATRATPCRTPRVDIIE